MRIPLVLVLSSLALGACFSSDKADDDDDDDDGFGSWGEDDTGGSGGEGVGGGVGGESGGEGSGGESGGETGTEPVDADGDGVSSDEDCDDNDASIYPGAQEICDPADNDEDCDGTVDDGDSSVDEDGFRRFYEDADGDGYGNPERTTEACDAPDGYVDNGEDCDDKDASANPTNPCGGDWEGAYSGDLEVEINIVEFGMSDSCTGTMEAEVDADAEIVGEAECYFAAIGIDTQWDVTGSIDEDGEASGKMTDPSFGSVPWSGQATSSPSLRLQGEAAGTTSYSGLTIDYEAAFDVSE